MVRKVNKTSKSSISRSCGELREEGVGNCNMYVRSGLYKGAKTIDREEKAIETLV